MPPLPRSHSRPSSALRVAILAVAAVGAALLPHDSPNDTLALLAASAALFAGHERRDRDMILAAGLALGLGAAGLLLAPLCLGLAIGRSAVRLLPLAAIAGATVAIVLPWTAPAAPVPNLFTLATAYPQSQALVAALAIGISAWLIARASVLSPAAIFAEARIGAVLLAGLLPLPIGALGGVLLLLVLPLPSPRRLRAANDNVAYRPTIRLAA